MDDYRGLDVKKDNFWQINTNFHSLRPLITKAYNLYATIFAR